MEKRSRVLPSDPEYLLEFVDTIPSDSDGEFGGYLSEDEDNEDNEEQDSALFSVTSPCLIPFSEMPGIIPNMTGKEPVEFFELFFDEETKSFIHRETCEHADRYFTDNEEYLVQHPRARAHEHMIGRKILCP
ncbi:hypothetical protein EMCRGX_G003746 [Ephydatia muelleri]